MAFVVFIFLALIVVLMCTLDSAEKQGRARKYHNNHPPRKYQEEYLLACELFQKYKQDPERQDPAGDALFDARKQIWESGYLPSVLDYDGMNQFNEHPIAMRQPYREINVSDPPHRFRWHPNEQRGEIVIRKRTMSYDGLLECREKDETIGELYHTEYCKQVKKDFLYDEAGWKAYCDKMDEWFERLGGVD